MRVLRIGLVGDYGASKTAHRAIPHAIDLAAKAAAIPIEAEWIATDDARLPALLPALDGIWCTPGSPYRSMDGALAAIRHARENGIPFLGTCGGFQHAVIEFARSVLGWADAEHAESAPGARRAVISLLACPLVDAPGRVRFAPGSRLERAYGTPEAVETYLCSYGVNPDFGSALAAGPLAVTAEDDAGDMRGVELAGHPFFVATLFQPERAALEGRVPPIVAAFAAAVMARARAGAST
jgi:CTP synthase (UTP-ammonia lyase)